MAGGATCTGNFSGPGCHVSIGLGGAIRATQMPFLRALQARLREQDGPDGVRSGSDGYYVRTNDDAKIGPMSGAWLSVAIETRAHKLC